MEKLTVITPKGEDAKIVIFTESEDSRIFMIDSRGGAKLIKPSADPQTIGRSPIEVRITCLFDKRPWLLEIGLESGLLSTGSRSRGLEEKLLLTPDILEFVIEFIIPK